MAGLLPPNGLCGPSSSAVRSRPPLATSKAFACSASIAEAAMMQASLVRHPQASRAFLAG
jgi:hypothetical protein